MKTNDTLFKMVTNQEFVHPNSQEAFKTYFRPPSSSGLHVSGNFAGPELQDFDINNDVIVYLHIQKVGGTVFNRHLLDDLDKGFDCGCTRDVVTNPCYCR